MKTKTFLFTTLLLAGFAAGTSRALAAFVPMNGTYSGMFYETNGYWQQSSGFITIKTTSRGAYSARLQIGSVRYSFSGRFAPDGYVSRDILRYQENPLNVQFQVDSEDPDLIWGWVGDGTWTADLYADRAVYSGKTNPSPDAGRYTMIIPGDFTSTNYPGGDGYGTLTVDKAGRLRFAGSLADGLKVTQATTVSKWGDWPFYAPLYWGEGSLYSWMQFGGANYDLSGDVTWIKPEMPQAWYYPAQFAIQVSAWGSRYVRPPKGTKVLNVSSASIEFNGGNLNPGITNHVTLDPYNRVANLSANGLKVAFSLSTGSFSGRVLHPVTWEWIPFRGVVLQSHSVAAGYFPGWDQTGEVWLQSE